jgi:septal ring factor EnvC (AmiA/AmiB activator)
VATEKPQRFRRDETVTPAIASELDELRAQLEAEQTAYDDVEAELIRTSGRLRALEQEVRVAWARVAMLEKELAYERLPRHRRIMRRRPKPPDGT